MPFGRKVKVIAAVGVTTLVLIVALQNSRPITLDLLFWRLETNLIALTVLLFLAGGVTGAILALLAGRKGSVPKQGEHDLVSSE